MSQYSERDESWMTAACHQAYGSHRGERGRGKKERAPFPFTFSEGIRRNHNSESCGWYSVGNYQLGMNTLYTPSSRRTQYSNFFQANQLCVRPTIELQKGRMPQDNASTELLILFVPPARRPVFPIVTAITPSVRLLPLTSSSSSSSSGRRQVCARGSLSGCTNVFPFSELL